MKNVLKVVLCAVMLAPNVQAAYKAPKALKEGWAPWVKSLPSKVCQKISQVVPKSTSGKIAASLACSLLLCLLLADGASAANVAAEVAVDGTSSVIGECPQIAFFDDVTQTCGCFTAGFWTILDAATQYLPEVSLSDLDDVHGLLRRFMRSDVGDKVVALMSPEKAWAAFNALAERGVDLMAMVKEVGLSTACKTLYEETLKI